ncbi:hypothetical protein [Miltoncostaea marina]|uniref:hypothetical protein n=1 Tax=Miltoncostaea marina TaxID=2843215 RepID=UPI001C3DC353|nr:hypothetical protein [Miltoncostaea marina]
MRLLRHIAVTLAVIALVAGPAALAGGLYVRDSVQSQLTAQEITFAPKGSEGLPPGIQSYGGTQVVNGGQAKVFADQYIAEHIAGTLAGAAAEDSRLDGVKTYSQISAVSRANPGDQKLEGLVETVFRGEMLRGSLLGAWGWWTFATIMLWSGVGMLAYAAIVGGTLVGARLAHRSEGRRHEPAAV